MIQPQISDPIQVQEPDGEGFKTTAGIVTAADPSTPGIVNAVVFDSAGGVGVREGLAYNEAGGAGTWSYATAAT